MLPTLQPPAPVPGLSVIVAFALIQLAETRLPPKFIKAAHGAQKALYASKYGYSVVPLPKRIELETKIHREVHGAPGRRYGGRRRRRPIRAPSPYYASRFKHYLPPPYKKKYKRRLRKRPPVRRPRPRPVYREEPDYYEQEIEDDYDENYEDYEEDRRRPVRQSLRGRRKKKKKRIPWEDEEADYTNQQPNFARPRPQLSVRTTKLYSAAIREQEEDGPPEILTLEDLNKNQQKGRTRPQWSEDLESRPIWEQPSAHGETSPWRPHQVFYHDRMVQDGVGSDKYTQPGDQDIGFGQGLELEVTREKHRQLEVALRQQQVNGGMRPQRPVPPYWPQEPSPDPSHKQPWMRGREDFEEDVELMEDGENWPEDAREAPQANHRPAHWSPPPPPRPLPLISRARITLTS